MELDNQLDAQMSIINKSKLEIEQITVTMPDKVDIDTLLHYTDLVLFTGLKKMHGLIDGANKEETSIGAFNAVVNLGKYLDKRKENADKRIDYLELDEYEEEAQTI